MIRGVIECDDASGRDHLVERVEMNGSRAVDLETLNIDDEETGV